MQSNIADVVCGVLLIIGALNWGFVGLVDMNVIELVLEPIFQPEAAEFVARTIYVVVGLAGIYFLYTAGRMVRDYRQQTRSSPS